MPIRQATVDNLPAIYDQSHAAIQLGSSLKRAMEAIVGLILMRQSRRTSQWRNYERRSEAIASGRQAAGGAFGRRIVCFALQNSAEFLKRERS